MHKIASPPFYPTIPSSPLILYSLSGIPSQSERPLLRVGTIEDLFHILQSELLGFYNKGVNRRDANDVPAHEDEVG